MRREQFLALLAPVCERLNHVGTAYFLMSKRYDLLMETADGNLPPCIRSLDGSADVA